MDPITLPLECAIHPNYIPLFAQTIRCFSKIGSDLMLEADLDCLKLRALNASRSVYILVTLGKPFFDYYRRSSEVPLRYNVKVQPCVQVFRSINQVPISFASSTGFIFKDRRVRNSH